MAKASRLAAAIIIPVIIIAFIVLVPVFPEPMTHIVDFQVPDSGDLKPTSYIYTTVDSPGGSDLDALWTSSSDLTGYFYTPDQFNNFKNALAGTPSGEAQPLDVATSTSGSLFVSSLPSDTTVYFVLWNRHGTDVTFSGLSAFTIWTAGQCTFTTLDYLFGPHDCFAPSNLATTTNSILSTGSQITTTSSSGTSTSTSSQSSSQSTTAVTSTISNVLGITVNREYFVRLNDTNYMYMFNVTLTNNLQFYDVPIGILQDSAPDASAACAECSFALNLGVSGLLKYSSLSSWVICSYPTPNSNGQLCPHDAAALGYLKPGETTLALINFVTAQPITPQQLIYSCPGQCANYWTRQLNPAPAPLSAETNTFPSQPTAISVMEGPSSFVTQVTGSSGRILQVTVGGTQPPTDLVGQTLSKAVVAQIKLASNPPWGLFYAGELTTSDVTFGCASCGAGTGNSMQVKSVFAANPDFSVVNFRGYTVSLPACYGIPTEEFLGTATVLIPPKLYGSVAVPYFLQFDISGVSPCP